jgi:hypothetical protein
VTVKTISQPPALPATVGALTTAISQGLRTLDNSIVPYQAWSCGAAFQVETDCGHRRPVIACDYRPDNGPVVPLPADLNCTAKPGPSRFGVNVWPTMIYTTRAGCCPTETVGHSESAARVLSVEESAQLSDYLWTGMSGSSGPTFVPFVTPNPSIMSVAQVVSTVALKPATALAVLERAIRQHGWRGTIQYVGPSHVRFPFLADGLAQVQGDLIRFAGSVAVLDSGIAGQAPAMATVPAPAGADWLAVTAQLEWDLGPMTVEDHTDLCSLETWGRARREGIVRFRPDLTFAVPVCWFEKGDC